MQPRAVPEISESNSDATFSGYGCIEDRRPETFNGDAIETKVEFKQIPGADVFFSSAADVIDEANAPGSIKHTLDDTVKKHIGEQEEYHVHNDSAHGNEYDGCGFMAKQPEIYTHLAENVAEIFKETQLPDSMFDRAEELAAAAGRLASNDEYFSISSGELVKKAIEEYGASLLTYSGDHTASTLIIDQRDDFTYDSKAANSAENDLETSFNLDADISLIKRAEEFGLDTEDAILFAEIVSVATVRVLGADGEVVVLSAAGDA